MTPAAPPCDSTDGEENVEVIPGLYAAGECAGGLFYEDYIGGGSIANCSVFGRIGG